MKSLQKNKKKQCLQRQGSFGSIESIKKVTRAKHGQRGPRKNFDENVLLSAGNVNNAKDSAEIYASQNRPDLAEPELEQMRVIQEYLPKQLTPEELERAVKDIITETGASSMKDMGKVMGVATKQLAGKAEGRAVSEMVKRLLS